MAEIKEFEVIQQRPVQDSCYAPIKSTQQIIQVMGKVLYNDKRRRIDLKRPIRDLFEGTSMEIFYTMELCLCPTKTMERIQDLSSEQIIPVLLYFRREEVE